MRDVIEPIAYIRTDFPEKFGIPRQSNLINELVGKIVFYPKYNNPDAVRGLSGFDYLWIIWKFDVPDKAGFTATVRPPRLGGNERIGVFASRSPFRPNHLGLSSVKLDRVVNEEGSVAIYVKGVDLRDGTKIYDIKPYLVYGDSHPEAKCGYVDSGEWNRLVVVCPQEKLRMVSEDKRQALIRVLEMDPRSATSKNKNKEYGMSFAGYNIQFIVNDSELIVTDITVS